MPLQQIARTGRVPLAPRPSEDSPPYGFAVRIIEDKHRIVVVRCPWCGAEEPQPVAFRVRLTDDKPRPALCGRGEYFVTVPAGTPVMAR
jgi:hypothetical protein